MQLNISNTYTTNKIYAPKQTSLKQSCQNILPHQQDLISFSGIEKQTSQVGTDAIMDLLRRCTDLLKSGNNISVIKEAADLIKAGEINAAIALLSKYTLPNGSIKEFAGETKILARNWDGSPKEHIFKHVEGFKNLGLYKDVSFSEIYQKAFGITPKTTVGMVGWTNVKPENIKGGTNLTKAELTEAYEGAISDFFEPIDRYFVKGLGIDPKNRALVSSVSYSGVDKAIMDMGERNGINTLTVTPFDYSIYGRNEHPFPTLITDTIPQYVNVYGKLSNNIVVTGGRDHAFKYDAGGKWLQQTDGIVIPVDVLKDYRGITVPAMINGKIENAAAVAYETFTNPLPAGLIEGFKNLPNDSLKQNLTHPAQQALATAMWKQLV